MGGVRQDRIGRMIRLWQGRVGRVSHLVVSCKHFFQLAAARASSSSEDATGAPSGGSLLPVRGEGGGRDRGRERERERER